MRRRNYLLYFSIMIVAITASSFSIKESLYKSSLFAAEREYAVEESNVTNSICHCTDLELQQQTTQAFGNFSALTTFISSEQLSASSSGYDVPCYLAAVLCAKKVTAAARRSSVFRKSGVQFRLRTVKVSL